MSEENKDAWVPVRLVNMAIDKFEHKIATLEAQKAALAAENEVLRKKVDWLQKADRLVVWNGTEWQVRHQLDGETRVAK